MNHKELIIQQNISARDALNIINNSALPRITLFIVDSNNTLLGTLAEGDIRRGLLNELPLSEKVTSFINKTYTFFSVNGNDFEIFEKCIKNGIRFVPVLSSDKKIQDIIDTSILNAMIPATAVLMAGGKGERLKPYTDKIPKPLLKVGQKSIIDYNIENLKKSGISDFNFTVKHMAKDISDHISQNFSHLIQANFILEDEPRGTAGSLSEVKNLKYNHVILMNSDLLTNIDFADMFRKMLESDADLVMATVPYYVDVPYAVINVGESDEINSLSEKPRYTYYSNAGIYIFKKEVIDFVPKQGKYDATDLVNDLIAKGKKIISFPITGYWLDIGRTEDFMKAQHDINYINFK